jgi:hypothetical protein
LIELWRIKSRLARGHPFSAKDDLKHASLDTIFATTFGSNLEATATHAKTLSTLESITLSEDIEAEAIMPLATTTDTYDSIVKVADSSGIPLKSPFPLLHHWLAVRLVPGLRKAIRIKDRFIHVRLHDAWERYESKSKDQQLADCAIDLMVQRETQAAEKDGRDVE